MSVINTPPSPRRWLCPSTSAHCGGALMHPEHSEIQLPSALRYSLSWGVVPYAARVSFFPLQAGRLNSYDEKLHDLSTVLPWADDFISLSLHVFICKMGFFLGYLVWDISVVSWWWDLNDVLHKISNILHMQYNAILHVKIRYLHISHIKTWSNVWCAVILSKWALSSSYICLCSIQWYVKNGVTRDPGKPCTLFK